MCHRSVNECGIACAKPVSGNGAGLFRPNNELLRCFLGGFVYFAGWECSVGVHKPFYSVCDCVPVEIVAPSYGAKTLLEGVLGDGLHGVLG